MLFVAALHFNGISRHEMLAAQMLSKPAQL